MTGGYRPWSKFNAHRWSLLNARRQQGSRFELLPCRGTYFQLARYDVISDLPDLEFAKWLTREVGVAVIPVSAFFQNRHDDRVVRFCFAKQESTLVGAGERLCRL